MAASIVVAAPVILFLEQDLWYLPLGLVYPQPTFYGLKSKDCLKHSDFCTIINHLIKIIGTFTWKQSNINNNAHVLTKYNKHFKYGKYQ